MSAEVVVDASALGAVLFNEPEGEPLASLVTQRLAAPTLIRYELASICRGKLLSQPSLSAVFLNQYSLPGSLDLELIEPRWSTLPSLASQWNLSVYDAAYLQIALDHGLPLVSLDARLMHTWREAVA